MCSAVTEIEGDGASFRTPRAARFLRGSHTTKPRKREKKVERMYVDFCSGA
jgi:hypothetical protein